MVTIHIHIFLTDMHIFVKWYDVSNKWLSIQVETVYWNFPIRWTAPIDIAPFDLISCGKMIGKGFKVHTDVLLREKSIIQKEKNNIEKF